MSKPELDLFLSFLSLSSNYLEFGTGGSTCLASKLVGRTILSVDSSRGWLEDVQKACAAEDAKVSPTLVYADIGKTGEWGYPVDPATRDRWPLYHGAVWDLMQAPESDLYLVDGRFRVACFMQILLRCRSDALIIVHDFRSRPAYHVIGEVAREIAAAEDLSVFSPLPGGNGTRVREILERHRFTPA